MRPLALFALLAALLSAPSWAENEGAAPAPGPGKDLVATACGGGLLVQPAEVDKPDAAAEGFAADADGAFSDLFDSSDAADEGEANKDGTHKPAPKKHVSKKPKTRLIRPRSEKEKAACSGRVKDLYEKYGDRLTGVPAPENVSTEQIEANIDRVFGLAAGPGKRQTLASFKDGDVETKAAAVRRLFDGVKNLDAPSFETIAKRSHDLAAAKSEGVLSGGLGASPTPDAAASAAALAAAHAAPKPEPLDTKADGSPLSPIQRQRFATPAEPPQLGGVPTGYRPPPVGASVPAGPPAESSYNRYVPNFVQRNVSNTLGG